MTLHEFLRRFITVHKCAGCGEILDYANCEQAFCPKCRLAWNAAKTVSCPTCFAVAVECECMPKQLSRAGALCHRKLFFYDGENSATPQMKLIYNLKHKKSRRITEFASRELLTYIRAETEVLGEGAQIVITNVPRSKKSLVLYGFDQSGMLARRLGELLHVEYADLFRKTHGSAQKELGATARLANAKKTLRLVKNADIKGKYVILIDDIVTSGASMSVCVKALMGKGAVGVMCASVASKNKM